MIIIIVISYIKNKHIYRHYSYSKQLVCELSGRQSGQKQLVQVQTPTHYLKNTYQSNQQPATWKVLQGSVDLVLFVNNFPAYIQDHQFNVCCWFNTPHQGCDYRSSGHNHPQLPSQWLTLPKAFIKSVNIRITLSCLLMELITLSIRQHAIQHIYWILQVDFCG